MGLELVDEKKDGVIAKPFLKWAGGKTQLLDEFEQRFPKKIKTSGVIETYIEPFVGSGAVYFYLWSHYDIKNAFLMDINREIIVGYRAIKHDVKQLIEKLEQIEHKYLSLDKEGRKAFYYEQREFYNEQMLDFNYETYNNAWIERAKILIFLNRTCFNGLFRQNKSGEFNVPHGRYKNPTICFHDRLLNVHQALHHAKIECADFTEANNHINSESFVYFDPPYLPINDSSSFTQYFKDDFTIDDQLKLADFFKKINQQGAFLMLSNSDPKNEDPQEDFFDNLYEKFNIERVPARRTINSNSKKRGEINELIIRNYP